MNQTAGTARRPVGLSRPKRLSLIIALLAGVLLIAGCGVDLQNPPRLATATAQAATPARQENGVMELPAPTPTPSSEELPVIPPNPLEEQAGGEIPTGGLTVWVDEVSPEHKRVLDDLAAEFADQHGIDVAVQLVSPSLLPDLVSTGILSDTLPDIVLHPIEFTAGWVDDGILDASAADEVVQGLGRDTFDPAAIELLTIGGQVAAVPSDGYHQLLLYRADWFDELNLRPPDTFEAMATAAERIFDPEAIISGLVIPTESNLVTTHQAFEQMALANGCELIDENGEVTILEPACQTAIQHYYTTINRFSPSGVQTDTSAVIALLTGRTGIIMTSPAILPSLAGLNPGAVPTCSECDESDGGINYLARNVGIITRISGPDGEPVGFGNIRSLGITTAAEREHALAFAQFWFEAGYERWLAVEPERKVPMRLGTADEPRRYIDAWGTTPVGDSDLSLLDIYGPEVVAQLRDGIAAAPRWGLRQGYGELLTQLYDDYTISIVLQEMLSGYFDTETTLREAYRRTVEMIPNYAFPDRLAEEEAEP